MWAVSETTANAVVGVRTANVQGFYILKLRPYEFKEHTRYKLRP
jgi:hypothetical protein